MAENIEKQETLKQSIGFSALGSVGTQVVSLLSFIILARLLSPHEFGLMAMVAIFTSFAAIFIEMGMGAALIHDQEATEEHESTVFWFNLGLSILCLMLIMMCSSSIAVFFHEPELNKILLITAFLLPLNALAIVPMAKLQKGHAFKKVAVAELGAMACGVLLAIILAMQGFGVWALVLNLLLVACVKVILLFFLSGWSPRLICKKDRLAELWPYSSYLMGTGIANYFITNVDSALIGRLLGSGALGSYKYAYQLATAPGLLVSSVFSRVFFASYARYKEDKEKIKRIHFKAIRMIAFCTFPMLATLAMVADPFVLTILGDQWQSMGHILSFMCVIFMLDSIGGMNNPLFLSQGKTKALFWLTVVLRSNLILAMVIGIQFGLDGLLWGLLIAKLINFFPVYVIVGKTIGFSVFSFVQNIMRPFGCSLVIVSILYCVQRMDFPLSSLMSLCLYTFIAIVVYLFASAVFQKETLHDIRKLFFRSVY